LNADLKLQIEFKLPAVFEIGHEHKFSNKMDLEEATVAYVKILKWRNWGK
jgi:hypothetical protein